LLTSLAELFYIQENAALVKDAEEYYRMMYHADIRTWNIRDNHMASTVQSVIRFHSKKHPDRTPKVVVWVYR
jgi:erythromycin esterase-like protein